MHSQLTFASRWVRTKSSSSITRFAIAMTVIWTFQLVPTFAHEISLGSKWIVVIDVRARVIFDRLCIGYFFQWRASNICKIILSALKQNIMLTVIIIL